MNSYFTSGSFGAPNSQNRKQKVYNQAPINSFTLFSRSQRKHGVRSTSQQNVEAQVGQMDRLARLKAKAIKNSKPSPPQAAAPPAFIVKAGRLQNNNQIVDPLDAFGQHATNVSWIHATGIEVGDTVSYTVGGTEFTTTVTQIIVQGVNNRNYTIVLTDPHNQGMLNANVKLYI